MLNTPAPTSLFREKKRMRTRNAVDFDSVHLDLQTDVPSVMKTKDFMKTEMISCECSKNCSKSVEVDPFYLSTSRAEQHADDSTESRKNSSELVERLVKSCSFVDSNHGIKAGKHHITLDTALHCSSVSYCHQRICQDNSARGRDWSFNLCLTSRSYKTLVYDSILAVCSTCCHLVQNPVTLKNSRGTPTSTRNKPWRVSEALLVTLLLLIGLVSSAAKITDSNNQFVTRPPCLRTVSSTFISYDRHPGNCSIFYVCQGPRFWEMTCSRQNTVFSLNHKVCVWKDSNFDDCQSHVTETPSFNQDGQQLQARRDGSNHRVTIFDNQKAKNINDHDRSKYTVSVTDHGSNRDDYIIQNNIDDNVNTDPRSDDDWQMKETDNTEDIFINYNSTGELTNNTRKNQDSSNDLLVSVINTEQPQEQTEKKSEDFDKTKNLSLSIDETNNITPSTDEIKKSSLTYDGAELMMFSKNESETLSLKMETDSPTFRLDDIKIHSRHQQTWSPEHEAFTPPGAAFEDKAPDSEEDTMMPEQPVHNLSVDEVKQLSHTLPVDEVTQLPHTLSEDEVKQLSLPPSVDEVSQPSRSPSVDEVNQLSYTLPLGELNQSLYPLFVDEGKQSFHPLAVDEVKYRLLSVEELKHLTEAEELQSAVEQQNEKNSARFGESWLTKSHETEEVKPNHVQATNSRQVQTTKPHRVNKTQQERRSNELQDNMSSNKQTKNRRYGLNRHSNYPFFLNRISETQQFQVKHFLPFDLDLDPRTNLRWEDLKPNKHIYRTLVRNNKHKYNKQKALFRTNETKESLKKSVQNSYKSNRNSPVKDMGNKQYKMSAVKRHQFPQSTTSSPMLTKQTPVKSPETIISSIPPVIVQPWPELTRKLLNRQTKTKIPSLPVSKITSQSKAIDNPRLMQSFLRAINMAIHRKDRTSRRNISRITNQEKTRHTTENSIVKLEEFSPSPQPSVHVTLKVEKSQSATTAPPLKQVKAPTLEKKDYLQRSPDTQKYPPHPYPKRLDKNYNSNKNNRHLGKDRNRSKNKDRNNLHKKSGLQKKNLLQLPSHQSQERRSQNQHKYQQQQENQYKYQQQQENQHKYQQQQENQYKYQQQQENQYKYQQQQENQYKYQQQQENQYKYQQQQENQYKYQQQQKNQYKYQQQQKNQYKYQQQQENQYKYQQQQENQHKYQQQQENQYKYQQQQKNQYKYQQQQKNQYKYQQQQKNQYKYEQQQENQHKYQQQEENQYKYQQQEENQYKYQQQQENQHKYQQQQENQLRKENKNMKQFQYKYPSLREIKSDENRFKQNLWMSFNPPFRYNRGMKSWLQKLPSHLSVHSNQDYEYDQNYQNLNSVRQALQLIENLKFNIGLNNSRKQHFNVRDFNPNKNTNVDLPKIIYSDINDMDDIEIGINSIHDRDSITNIKNFYDLTRSKQKYGRSENWKKRTLRRQQEGNIKTTFAPFYAINEINYDWQDFKGTKDPWFALNVETAPVSPELSPVPTVTPETVTRSTAILDNVIQSTAIPDTVIPSKTSNTVIPSTATPDTVIPSTTTPDNVIPSTTIPDTVIPSTTTPNTVIPSTATLSTEALTTSTATPATPATPVSQETKAAIQPEDTKPQIFDRDFVPSYRQEMKDRCGVLGTPYIIGGRKSIHGQWPWQVSLQIVTSTTPWHRCGGVLVHERWVLTAAHCMEGPFYGDISNWRVVIADYDLEFVSGTEIYRDVIRIISHPGYVRTSNFPNDVALLELDSPVDMTSGEARAACLPDTEFSISPGIQCWISGWGETRGTGGREHAMNEVAVEVLPHDQCKSMWGKVHIDVLDTQLCLGHGETGACYGDSGGPLMCESKGRFYVAGVMSWLINNCSANNFPNVFTRLPNYMDWLHKELDYFEWLRHL